MLQTLNLSGTDYVVIEKKHYEELTARDDECFPAEFVDELFTTDNKIGAWRKYRGVTMTRLAEITELSQGYISDIENGKKDGSIKAIKAIAEALDADIELII